MNLGQRIAKAEKLNPVEIPNHNTILFRIAGSQDDFYEVELTKGKEIKSTTIDGRPVKRETIYAKCQKDEGLFSDNTDCPGNSNHATVCYHVMAAVQLALDNQGKEIYFCKDLFMAQGRIQWHGGHLVTINSKTGHKGYMWAVIRDKPKSVNHGDLETRVNSLRGSEEEEEGID